MITRREIERRWREARTEHDRLWGQRLLLQARRNGLQEEIASLERQLATLGKTLVVFQELAGHIQTDFLAALEGLVSSGLRSVFGSDLSFRLIPSVKNKAMSIEFLLADGQSAEGQQILDARGGGVAALCGVLLRAIVLRLLPDRRQVLVLDEATAHLSEAYLPASAALFRSLADDLGLQLVLVTHQEEYAEAADVVWRLRRDNAEARIERVK